MRTRHAVLLLALLGSFGAAALAIAAHRTRLNLDLAQRVGGDEARAALLASARFAPLQELGFLALALIFLALFLLQMSLQNERVAAEKQLAKRSIEIPPADIPRALAAPAPVILSPEPVVVEPLAVAVADAPAVPREESAPPHA
jgi:hypothetical protein